jgi:KDO2-lipid IV(A) lauroyltransferase
MPKKSLKKRIRYFFEAVLVAIVLFVFKILPFKTASNLGGFITEKFGNFSKTNLILRKNLRLAFKNKTQTELLKIEKECWQNLGNLAGEFANLGSLDNSEFKEIVSYKNFENFEAAKQKYGKVILVSGHIGNWEIGARVASEIVPDINFIYRKANNPFVEKLIQKIRTPYLKNIISKGSSEGIKGIIKHIKNGGSLAMLVDQKFTGGAEVNFFGQKVTAPDTHADFAFKFNMPIVPTRIIRLKNAKFVAEFFPAIEILGKTKQQIVQEIYNVFEANITEYPAQWFWMHNRFGLKKQNL